MNSIYWHRNTFSDSWLIKQQDYKLTLYLFYYYFSTKTGMIHVRQMYIVASQIHKVLNQTPRHQAQGDYVAQKTSMATVEKRSRKDEQID